MRVKAVQATVLLSICHGSATANPPFCRGRCEADVWQIEERRMVGTGL